MADTYSPNEGMKAAARRALKWKEDGKATGAGTPVGWGRATDIVNGSAMSLDTVKRMYSFFSRHEVDKKGKDWDNAENPSNGKIMWLAWGGDAGFSWSRRIVEREKNMKKSLTTNDLVEEIKDILDNVVNPIETVIEMKDEETVTKALRPEVTREQMYAVIEHLQEAIEALIEMPEEEEEDSAEEPEAPETMENSMAVVKTEHEDTETEEETYKSDDPEDYWDNNMQKCWTGYRQDGMKEKGGRMVPNCVPIEKAEDLTEADLVTKSLWSGTFLK